MRSGTLFLAFTILFVAVTARFDPKNLKCLVCRAVFVELDEVIKKVDKLKKADAGNIRMDASGNTMQDEVTTRRSAVDISELIDGTCKRMEDYVRVFYKSTDKLVIMKIHTKDGMNPEYAKTKSVPGAKPPFKKLCERTFKKYEDEITSLLKTRSHNDIMPEAEREICFNRAKYCEKWMLPNKEDTTWTREMEAAYVKVHGLNSYGGFRPQREMSDFTEDYYDPSQPY